MSDCIKTTCALNHAGYGVSYNKDTRKTVLHHRLAYVQANNLSVDDIKGKVVRHTCDNPACVNPDHLILGTQQDNMRDMWERNRARPGVALGERAGGSILTAAQVLEIRSAKGTQAEIAARYGVSRATVCSILLRRIWKHI